MKKKIIIAAAVLLGAKVTEMAVHVAKKHKKGENLVDEVKEVIQEDIVEPVEYWVEAGRIVAKNEYDRFQEHRGEYKGDMKACVTEGAAVGAIGVAAGITWAAVRYTGWL